MYKSRLRMGDYLARKILRATDHGIDVVIPVPDTSRTAAIQVAYHLGAKFREGFIKNRYIGRTFIMPGQGAKESVRQKLNPISWSSATSMCCWWTIRSFVGPCGSSNGREAGAKLCPSRRRRPGSLPQRLRHRHAAASARTTGR